MKRYCSSDERECARIATLFKWRHTGDYDVFDNGHFFNSNEIFATTPEPSANVYSPNTMCILMPPRLHQCTVQIH